MDGLHEDQADPIPDNDRSLIPYYFVGGGQHIEIGVNQFAVDRDGNSFARNWVSYMAK